MALLTSLAILVKVKRRANYLYSVVEGLSEAQLVMKGILREEREIATGYRVKIEELKRELVDLRVSTQEENEVDSCPRNGWFIPAVAHPPCSKEHATQEPGTCQGSGWAGDITPKQASIYVTSSGSHTKLTKNTTEKHYKGKGLIRPARTSQRDYQSRH